MPEPKPPAQHARRRDGARPAPRSTCPWPSTWPPSRCRPSPPTADGLRRVPASADRVLTGGTAVAIAVLVAVVAVVVTGGRGASSAVPAPGGFAAIHTGPQGMVPPVRGEVRLQPHRARRPHRPPRHGRHVPQPRLLREPPDQRRRRPPTRSTAGPTTCNQRRDTAAYWAPTLFDHGVAGGARSGAWPTTGRRPASTRPPSQPFPAGLMMIAGNSMAEDPSPSRWRRGRAAARRTCRRPADLPRRRPAALARSPSPTAGTACTSTAPTTGRARGRQPRRVAAPRTTRCHCPSSP